MSDYEIIPITLDPPCKVRTEGKQYILEVDGREVQLPVSKTKLVVAGEGELVEGVRIPKWLAQNEKLAESVDDVHSELKGMPPIRREMSRYDWYHWGATMVFLVLGREFRQAIRDGRLVADTVIREEEA